MEVAFRIVEQKQADYEEMKQAYLKGVRGVNLRKMFNLGTSSYTRLLRDFRADGIIIPRKGNVKTVNHAPKYYHKHLCKGRHYWTVSRTVNYKKVYFGHYATESEAIQRVKELQENNWEGAFD